MTDNYKSSRMVTEYLLSLGVIPSYLGSVHKKIYIAIKERNRDIMKRRCLPAMNRFIFPSITARKN
jgi:hypothetical protein